MSDCKTLGLGPTETYIETIHIFPDTLLLSLILYARLGRLGPILPPLNQPAYDPTDHAALSRGILDEGFSSQRRIEKKYNGHGCPRCRRV